MQNHHRPHSLPGRGKQLLLALGLALGLTTAHAERPVDNAASHQAEFEAHAWVWPAHGESPATPKAGFTGPREGDMDPTLTRHPGEPGVGSYYAPYGDRITESRAFAVGQRSDGRMILAGEVGDAAFALTDPVRIGIFQLLSDGQPDASFGNDGLQTFDTDLGSLDIVDGVYFHEHLHGQDWERIYLLGHYVYNANESDFALMCFRRPGTASNAFEPCGGFPAGIRFYSFGERPGCSPSVEQNIPYALHLDRSTSAGIYMAGSVNTAASLCTQRDWGVMRVHMNGDPDDSFGGGAGLLDGTTIIPVAHRSGISPYRGAAYGIAALPDGRIVVAGSVMDNASGGGVGAEDALMVRLLRDGGIDTSFCVTGNADCTSPAAYRNGRRGFDDITPSPALVHHVVALTATDGNDVFAVRRSGGGAIVQRIDGSGGCTAPFCNPVQILGPIAGSPIPSFGTFRPVALHWERRGTAPGVQYVTLAGWGARPGGPNEAFVHRLRTGTTWLEDDFDFVTLPSGDGPRQEISWPTLSTVPVTARDARVNNMTVDRQGRVLLAADVQVRGAERDMAIARLQGILGDHLFSDGFEEP